MIDGAKKHVPQDAPVNEVLHFSCRFGSMNEDIDSQVRTRLQEVLRTFVKSPLETTETRLLAEHVMGLQGYLVLESSERTLDEMRKTAKATRLLALATVVLAGATVVLAVVSVIR